jgi:membrane protease YdiL (CAAX protease family)
MLQEVWSFYKNPEYVAAIGDLRTRIKMFITLTALAVAFSLALGILMHVVTDAVGFENQNHTVMEMIERESPLFIFFIAVIVAPVLEESFFRAPLGFFKKSRYFKTALYISVILFGLIHISNFENMEGYYWLTPILVAPQLFAGFFLGFTRVKLGLGWAMLLHATHNLILLGPFIFMKMFDIPFE